MSADRCCGCDGISNPDPAKFDSNRHYSTCPFYREQSVNDLITDVLCDVEVIDSGFPIKPFNLLKLLIKHLIRE